MTLPSNLIIFNSNKKIVQLSKVVSNLQFTLDTCMFQISTFENRFSVEFQDIFNAHESTIIQIITDINNHKGKIIHENYIMYSQNHEKMQDQYTHLVETLTTSITSEENKFLDEIQKLKKDISDITAKINKLSTLLTDPLSDIFSSSTCETIPILQAKYEEELRLHDEESEKKFKTLKDEMTKKIESYNLSYSKAADNLKKQFLTTTKDLERMKAFSSLKEKCKVLNFELKELRENFLNLKKENESLINKIKQNCLLEVNDYKKVFFERNQQVFDVNNQFEKIESESSNEIESLTEKIRFLKEKNLEEITKLQSQMAQLLLNFKVELEKKKSLHHENETFSEEQFNNLKEQHQKEFNRIKEENETLHKQLIEKNKNIQIQLSELLNLCQIDKNEKMSQLHLLKEKNSKELSKLKDEQDDELHLEYAKFESKMSVLLKKLGQNKSLISDSKCADETKIQLENELKNLREKIENDIKQFDLSFQKEKDLLSSQNDSSFKNFQDEENKKFVNVQAKLNGQIDDIIEKHKSKKKELIALLKLQYENKINQVPRYFVENNAIPGMIQEYNNQYKNLKRILNEEMVEVTHESNEEQLQDAIHEKDDLLLKIEKEKSNLFTKLKSFEEDEQKRHNFALSMLVPAHKDDEIDIFRKKCKDRISNLIQRQDDLLFTLRKLKETNQNQSLISASGYLEDEEVINLRKYLEILRNDLKNQRHSKQLDFEESIAKKNEEIEITINQIQEYNEKARLSIEKQTIENNEEIQSVKRAAAIRYQSILDQISNEKISNQNHIEKVQNQIKDKINKLRETLNTEKENYEKMQSKLKIEVEKDRINNHMKFTETYEQYNSEINLLKNKLEEFEKQSKDQIKVYEEICLKSKKKAEVIPMRPEEKNEIKRLEEILELKTQQLTVVAKDLMGYKNRLKQQEDEYNKRFGVAPQVAVLGGGENRRQTKSAALVKKPLPPLKNSSVC